MGILRTIIASGRARFDRPNSGFFSDLAMEFITLLEFFQFRLDKWRSRRVLEELSDHQLRDIGFSREEAKAEAEKGFFWD